MNEGTGRSWDSVCGDCGYFEGGCCAATGREADAQDSFAAICGRFEPLQDLSAAQEGS